MIWSVNGSGTTLITRRFIRKRTALFRRSKLDPTTRYVTEIDPCVVNAVFVKLMELEDEQEETNHMNEIEQDELDEDMTAEL